MGVNESNRQWLAQARDNTRKKEVTLKIVKT